MPSSRVLFGLYNGIIYINSTKKVGTINPVSTFFVALFWTINNESYILVTLDALTNSPLPTL